MCQILLTLELLLVELEHACEEIKVQLVLQFGVSRGRSEVLLALRRRGYLSEVVSEFEPKT